MTPVEAAILFVAGAVASGINAVAGGGSLVSYPVLTQVMRVTERIANPERIANATNSVGLFPGSLSGAYGFIDLFKTSGKHLKTLLIPTILGSLVGAALLLNTSDHTFKKIIPVLVLLAAVLLLLQPKVKKLVGGGKSLPFSAGLLLQFLVSVYGGYFGAGMGIMMLACFAFYMEGNVHELNAVKNWLAVIINFTCSIVFVSKGLVLGWVAFWLVAGSLVGGFAAARVSQRFDPNKLRLVIGVYGLLMAGFFAYQAYVK